MSDPLCECLVSKDLSAPITQLFGDPNAFTCELEICPTDWSILVMVIMILFAHSWWSFLLEPLFELIDLFQFSNTFLQTICHIVNEAIKKSFKKVLPHQVSHTRSIAILFPKLLEQLRAVVAILKLCEKHSLASKFNVNVEMYHSLHNFWGN
jgi:hypothetical protein